MSASPTSTAAAATSSVAGQLPSLGKRFRVCCLWFLFSVSADHPGRLSSTGCRHHLGGCQWCTHRRQFSVEEERTAPLAGGWRGRGGCSLSQVGAWSQFSMFTSATDPQTQFLWWAGMICTFVQSRKMLCLTRILFSNGAGGDM